MLGKTRGKWDSHHGSSYGSKYREMNDVLMMCLGKDSQGFHSLHSCGISGRTNSSGRARGAGGERGTGIEKGAVAGH